MMNLLARILSHGFAFAVVALIIIVFMYRGELFEDTDLPDFLVISGQPGAESATGTVDRTTAEAAAPATAPVATPEPVEETPVSPSPEDEASAQENGSPEEPASAGEPDREAAGEEMPTPAPVESRDEAAATDAGTTAAAEETPAVESATGEASPGPAAQTTATMAEETSPPEQTAEAAATGDEVAAEDTMATGSVAPLTTGEETPVAEEVAPVVAENTSPEAAPEPVAAPEAVAEPEPVAEQEPATTETAATQSPYAVMARAREAYWLRDFDTAEQQYRLLTQIDPDNPDSYGEMGNMYFSQGKWDEAAAAYYESGTRLLKDGLIVQARQMLEVIRGLNGSRADELEEQINAANTP